jgi:hypothetical protein
MTSLQTPGGTTAAGFGGASRRGDGGASRRGDGGATVELQIDLK